MICFILYRKGLLGLIREFVSNICCSAAIRVGPSLFDLFWTFTIWKYRVTQISLSNHPIWPTISFEYIVFSMCFYSRSQRFLKIKNHTTRFEKLKTVPFLLLGNADCSSIFILMDRIRIRQNGRQRSSLLVRGRNVIECRTSHLETRMIWKKLLEEH